MAMKSPAQKKYMEYLEAKGKLPKLSDGGDVSSPKDPSSEPEDSPLRISTKMDHMQKLYDGGDVDHQDQDDFYDQMHDELAMIDEDKTKYDDSDEDEDHLFSGGIVPPDYGEEPELTGLDGEVKAEDDEDEEEKDRANFSKGGMARAQFARMLMKRRG